MLKRTPTPLLSSLKWALPALAMLVLSLALLTGCKKEEAKKIEPAPDTVATLPEPPELEPIEDAFPEAGVGEPATPSKTTAKTEAKAAPTASTASTQTVSKAASSTPAAPAAKPAVQPAAPNQGIVKTGAYTLQIGIFNSEKQAKKRAGALVALGLPAYVTHVQDPKPTMPGSYYRVRVGSFASSQAAKGYGATNLTPAGIDFWADLKGRDTAPVQQVFKAPPASPKIVPAPAATETPAAAPQTPAAASQMPAEPAKPSTPAAPGDSQPAPKLSDW